MPVARSELLAATLGVTPVAVVFGIVIGGIYAGIYSPTAAAAIGVFAVGLYGFGRGRLTVRQSFEALLETARTSGMIFLILLGAELLKIFMARAGVPQAAAALLQDSGLSPLGILTLIIVIFIILGCLMDSLSMVILAIPFFWPVVAGLDFGLDPEETEDLVRHHHPDRRGIGPDHAAGRAQRLHHPLAVARRADAADFQGRDAVLRRRDRARHHPRGFSGDHAAVAAAAAIGGVVPSNAIQLIWRTSAPRRRRG